MSNLKAAFKLNLSGTDLSTCYNMLPCMVYHFTGTSSATLINVCLLLKKEIKFKKIQKKKSDVKKKISAGILPVSRHLEAAGLPYLFSIISVITTSVLAVI